MVVDKAQYNKEYRQKHRERLNLQDRIRYKHNRERIRKQQKEYWEQNKETILARQKKRYETVKNTQSFKDKNRSRSRKHWASIKNAIFDVVGYECVGWNGNGCPFHCNDTRCMQIDHKYGNGRNEIRKFGSTISMYIYYRDNPDETKNKLQPLCANCNWIKRYENNERFK